MVIQVRNDCGLNQDIISGGSEKMCDSRYVLKVELTGFSDRLEAQKERIVFGLSNFKDGVIIY